MAGQSPEPEDVPNGPPSGTDSAGSQRTVTTGGALNRLGRSLLWTLFFPIGVIVSAPGAWLALRDLERCEPELELRAPRLAAITVGLAFVASFAVRDPAVRVAISCGMMAVMFAGIFDFARTVRSWSKLASTPAASGAWRKVQIVAASAVGLAVATALIVRAGGDGTMTVAGNSVDSGGPIGATIFVAVIVVAFATFAYLDSAADHTKVALDPTASLHVPFYRRWRAKFSARRHATSTNRP